MSSTVNTPPTAGNYAPTDAPQEANASASQTPVTTQPTATQVWEKEQQKKDRDELDRAIVAGIGQSYADSLGADDEDNAASLHKVRQGAHAAGISVTDKGMSTMHNATKGDPGTRKLIDKLKDPGDADTQKLHSDLAEGKKPDLGFMQKAFVASPGAALPASATAPGTSEASAAGSDVAPGANGASPGAGAVSYASAPGSAPAEDQGSAAASGLSNGAPANGSQANGTAANGTPASAAPANATPAIGTAANGAPANGTAANGAAANATNKYPGVDTTPTVLGNTGVNHLSGGNWSTFVAMAMYNSTKELQTEKKSELGQIKKYNAMLDAVNQYVSGTLMPAQQALQTRVANTKDKDKAANLEETIYNPLRNVDTTNCNYNPATGGAVLIQAPGTEAPPMVQKVTQTQLSSMIQEADQWRTSISNNQQLHSSNFQSLDTQVTSALNMIVSLFKNVNETQTGITRNLPT